MGRALNTKALASIRAGYLYVAREDGSEIKGSRRELAGVRSMDEYEAIRRDLERAMGEGCMVRHSCDGDAVPW